MSNSPTVYVVANDTSARQAAQKRMFWKLLAVVVAFAAFLTVRGLERARDKYNEQRTRPIVIVEKSDLPPVSAVRDAQLIATEDLSRTLATNVWENGTEQDVSSAVRKIKYQSFPNGNAILDRLDQEILAEADYNKKSFLAIEEAENKAAASRLPDLSQDASSVVAKLEDIYRSEKTLPVGTPVSRADLNAWAKDAGGNSDAKDFEQWRLKLAKGQEISNEDLKRWLTAINRQSNDQIRLTDLRARIAAIDERAQTLTKAVYTGLKPQLPQIIKDAVNAPGPPDESALSFLNPRLVLDSNSGIHVIYQTVWLACVLILILAVIVVLIAALRPLPFFASATDTIKEHAEELFKRPDGAGPQLAKSLVVTAAALGVGTAVAVSGTNAVGKRPPPEVGQISEPGRPDDRTTDPGGPRKPTGTTPPVEHIVTFSPPIVYPSPVTVSGPDKISVDADSLEPLKLAISQIRTNPPSRLSDTELKQMEALAQSVTNTALTGRLGNVNVPELSTRSDGFKQTLDTFVQNQTTANSQLSSQLQDLTKWRSGVEKDFATTLASLRDQLADTNRAVADLRNASLERPQNSGGRNLFTRAVQVFKSNKYLVTAQSVRALSSLMVKSPVENCAPPNAARADFKPCCGATPTTARYSCDNPDIEALLVKLSAMLGHAPQKESDLMKELSEARRVDGQVVSQPVVQQWQSIILKYTRSAY